MATLALSGQDRKEVVAELLPLVRPLISAISEQRVKVDGRTRSALSELHGDAANGWAGYILVDSATVAKIGTEHWRPDIAQGKLGSPDDVGSFRGSLEDLVDKCRDYSS
jgi:hypothetical protein